MSGKATNQWPKGCRKIVERNLPRKCKVICCQADNPSVGIQKLMTSDMVISYSKLYEIFIIWNSHLHRYLHSTDQCTLNYGTGYPLPRILKSSQAITARYVSRNNTSKFGDNVQKTAYEKVVFVKREGLLEFCLHYEDYLYPDAEENGFHEPAILALPNEPIRFLTAKDNAGCQLAILREKDTIARIRRDPHFRDKILRKFGNTCLVCGTQETTILEAAHIISVSDGGSDDAENGLCLCRNHHRLFDAGLMDVCLESNSYTCRSEAEKEMAWYKEGERRGFTLFTNV